MIGFGLIGEWRKYCTGRNQLTLNGDLVRLVVHFDKCLTQNWWYGLACKAYGDYFSVFDYLETAQ